MTKPQLRIHIDRDRAAALGVSIEDMSRTMQMLFGGLDLSRIKIGGKEYEVIAQLERQARLRPQDLERLYVRNSAGRLIQLSSIVSYTEGAAPNAIEHYSRLRSATIGGTPIGMPLGTAMDRVEALLDNAIVRAAGCNPWPAAGRVGETRNPACTKSAALQRRRPARAAAASISLFTVYIGCSGIPVI